MFGCYCLGKLGYDLVTFNDYPKEIQKLEEVGIALCTFYCGGRNFLLALCEAGHKGSRKGFEIKRL